ncbi:ORF6N domain-containing protein [Escherichia coli]|nr:ORF6N domain-containing protein [Escherichia coli]EFB3905943.1 ORF6N domain-containing protein [Escherichia coli]EFN3765141.1 ORF6N domain-containing protein [Escherichia coli]
METVLHALKAMGKANSVELAARIDISREEVLNELWELKKNGVVGKHFFKAVGDELKNLRLVLNESQNEVKISPKTRTLILWTERGAARHAKMLETDQAWEVFEKLEDSYFNQYEKERAMGKMNIDFHLAIRDDKTAFIRSYAPGQLVTVEEALALLKSRGWLVMPRDELAGKLMEL